MRKVVELDDFDRRLIELVRRDNLEPARTLADTVGLSISAVLRRLRRLREAKVIVADIAVVDPALTGSALTMHVLVRMKQPGLRALDLFAREILGRREVTGAWEVTGDDDFVLKVQVGSMEEYDMFTREVLHEDGGVQSFKTLIAMRTVIEDDVSRRPLLDP
jgi:DNA-binding Lrp family transcriptional regulator